MVLKNFCVLEKLKSKNKYYKWLSQKERMTVL
jgi:hypothetical protein